MKSEEGSSSSISKGMKIPENKQPIKKSEVSILLADDEYFYPVYHSHILVELGLKPEFAKNGKEVVDLFLNGAMFDIVLMDNEMPIMNGIEATKKLREIGVKSLIVGVSDDSSESKKEAFMTAGLEFFCPKPLTNSNLNDLWEKLKK